MANRFSLSTTGSCVRPHRAEPLSRHAGARRAGGWRPGLLQPALVTGLLLVAGLSDAAPVRAQESVSTASHETAAPSRQTSADSYTRYELGDPAKNRFRIIYDVSATTAGSTRYYNPIRPGSEPEVHGVIDRFTGAALPWKLVTGTEAARHLRGANPEGQYIEVMLARPVPEGGETRLRIDKTYVDPASYSVEGDGVDRRLLFDRSLGIPRNAIVLPVGWELVACSVPAQVSTEADGRLRVSFLHRTPGPAALRIEARPIPARIQGFAPPKPDAFVQARPAIQITRSGSARTDRPRGLPGEERAFQDREIVYFLQEPETHSFRLYHDYTETRPGMDRYLNVVRAGSRATDPSAFVLDTGEKLRVETLRGEEITAKGLEIGSPVTDASEVVAIWFDPVKPGHSTRLRIWETYTDPGRYGLHPSHPDGSELLWDRSFGRSRNTVVLPPGWRLTESTIPARVDLDDEGRVRLLFENDRPDQIEVLLRARRR